MPSSLRCLQRALCGLVCLAAAILCRGQEPTTRLTVEFLEGRIAAVQAAEPIDEASRTRLISLYRQSIGNLQTANANRAAYEDYRQELRAAPAETARIRADNARRDQRDPAADLDLSATVPLTELVRALNDEIANQSTIEANLAVIEARLESDAARPNEARQRIAVVRAQIDQLGRQAGESSGDGQTPQIIEAMRWAAQTELESLRTEIAMLDQELLSHSVRNDLLKAQQEAALLSRSRVDRRVDVLRRAIADRRRSEAERARDQALAVLQSPAATEELIRELAEANLNLVEQLREQVAEREMLEARERDRPRAAEIESAFRSARQKLSLEGSAAPVGLAILEERSQFPSIREYGGQRRVVSRSITTVSLRLFELEDERQTLNDVAEYVEGRIADSNTQSLPPAELAVMQELAESRRSLLDRVIENDTELQQRLYELDDALRRLADRTRAYDEYLTERMLWVRSTRPLDTAALARLPRDVARYLAPERWLEVVRSAATRLLEAPAFLLIVLIGFVTAGGRKRLHDALLECGSVVGHVESDSIAKTFQALGYSVLLAAPLPLVLAGVGGALATATDVTAFSVTVGFALLLTAAWLSFPVSLHVLFAPGGVAERHFGWSSPTLSRIRRQLKWFIVVTFPAYFVLLTSSGLEGSQPSSAQALTLIAVAVIMGGLAGVSVGLVHPGRGPVQEMLSPRTRRRWWRWRYVWFGFLIVAPIATLALAMLGYTYMAQELSRRVLLSIWFLIAVWLGTALVRRWLLVTAARLAYEESIAAREGGPQQRAKEATRTAVEPVTADAATARDVNLVALGSDSRQLLNATTLVVIVLGLSAIWGAVFPALGIFDSFTLWNGTVAIDGVSQLAPVTLWDLMLAIVVSVGGYVVATNLPSLLDIILLRQGSIGAGGRYTVATLTRYVVTAITVLVVLSLLGVNGSQLGWAAAALGVGIGFGLQEIVANFICGLILLFEQPIRVGDTITAGDASGTVTRIRIRATTIRDWDQKELVVPNKELITGRLLNWSLSDSVTRLLITVGVAYGSDVERAMELMREAAGENEHVLGEPPITVHFERFGDSSLILTLRAYVGALSERLQTLTDLHRAIDNKFREAGIVIAFPQRDVHIYKSDV